MKELQRIRNCGILFLILTLAGPAAVAQDTDESKKAMNQIRERYLELLIGTPGLKGDPDFQKAVAVLDAKVEKEMQALAREPLKWLGMPKREDLGSLRERLKTLETRIDELDKALTSAKSRRRRTA